jgi:uncharacterized protein (DUF4213/DUF364 family)
MGYLAAYKWYFYNTLLNLVPKTATVTNCALSRAWVMVESDLGGTGLAHFLGEGEDGQIPKPSSLIGQPLIEVAKRVKSWDNGSAAIGLAAINAAANSRLGSLITPETLAAPRLGSVFDYYLDRVKGLRVAVVGHLPNLESWEEETTLTILERHPQPGNLPYPAAEFVLEDQDAIFLTGATIINKTFPHLLELAVGRRVFLVGPSVPMFEELFKYPLASLSGTLVADPKDLAAAINEGLAEEIFERGALMVNLFPPEKDAEDL